MCFLNYATHSLQETHFDQPHHVFVHLHLDMQPNDGSHRVGQRGGLTGHRDFYF